MITLKSHKTVLPGRAEGERRGMSPKRVLLRQPSQAVREGKQIFRFYFSLTAFQNKHWNFSKKSVGNDCPAKLALGIS
jgi:hypothetical protein